ncbi:MAG: hypothetical protein NWF01_07895 [Candidatus Bathyarchaeota archaeon]|nr:hypothetical protein [Candidatus Bathyarchaeota archaeon]
MDNLVKRALTRRRQLRGRPEVEEPDERLVLGVEFAIGMTICLSALEVAHMAFLGSWNSEIFAAITCLTGTIIGLFVGKKA